VSRHTRVLFLGQGRAGPSDAMGHARAVDALKLGMAHSDVPLEYRFDEVPALARWQRALVRPIPGLGDGGRRTLRWHLLRSYGARRIAEAQLRHARPDVIQVTTSQVSLLLGDRFQRRVPVVFSNDITNCDWLRLLKRVPDDAPLPPYLRRVADLERGALNRAALCIAWTDSVMRRVRALAPAANVMALHPGIDLEAFRPRVGPRPPGPLRILFVGARWERKGGPDLLAALGPVLGAGVELHVVTPEEIPQDRGITVHRLRSGSDELVRLFQRADIFCLPSRADAVPWVVLEALACGVPVIASAMGSIPEMVGEAGLVTRAGDIEGLRDAIGTLSEDPALRTAMGEAARARAEASYDARTNTPAWLAALAAAATGGRAAPES
jgi:glycosyltransferase involved in cell wall biosynthesis